MSATDEFGPGFDAADEASPGRERPTAVDPMTILPGGRRQWRAPAVQAYIRATEARDLLDAVLAGHTVQDRAAVADALDRLLVAQACLRYADRLGR